MPHIDIRTKKSSNLLKEFSINSLKIETFLKSFSILNSFFAKLFLEN